MIVETIKKLCGGNNSYDSTKVMCNPHGEMTATIRTNKQEIANSNEKLQLFGYTFGKWLIKKTNVYFMIGLYNAIKEGF
jgi:hypothetical protein